MSDAVPVVEAHGLLLRPWTADDAPDVLRLALDPVTKTWSPSLTPVNDLADARGWIAKRQGGDRLDWAATDPASGEIVARVGLHHFDGDVSAELGYGVWPGHRGRGVARRAALAATEYGFGPRGLAKVNLMHAVGNAASCAVASSTGFVLEGVEWSMLDHGDGVLHDIHRHGRTTADPPTRLAPAVQPLLPVELDAGRWRLVPWRGEDLAELMPAFAEPHIVAWNPRLPLRDEADAIRWLTGRQRGWVLGSMAAWAVRDAGSGELVGSVTLRDIVHRRALVAYWVRRAFLGRGIAPTALATASAYAFGTLGLHRLGLYHALDNTASCRVAAKAGFRLEGTTRGSDRLTAGWVDEHLHARLATD